MEIKRVVTGRLRHLAWRATWAVRDSVAGIERRVPEGFIALTFDDGPHPESTGPILDVLGELGITATFFCVGRNAQRYPDLVARALAEGHVVGSHSFSHPHPRDTARSVLAADYRDGRAAVTDAAGREVALFRPPHGHVDLGDAVLMRRLRMSPWLWTVDPEDWRPGVTCQDVVAVTSRARSGDVVLLHDWVEQPLAPEALDRSATVTALPAIAKAVLAQGLGFTGLPA